MEKAKRERTTGNFDARLTPGEELLIWRRRMDWNQIEAANYFGCSIFRYKLAEYDSPKVKDFNYRKVNITLRPYERCLIYRKRAKKTQHEIAEELGICRTWLQQQEAGEVPCDKLLQWWENAATS